MGFSREDISLMEDAVLYRIAYLQKGIKQFEESGVNQKVKDYYLEELQKNEELKEKIRKWRRGNV